MFTITIARVLQSRFCETQSGFQRVMQLNGDIYRHVKSRKTLRFEHEGQGYFAKLHFGVGWAEILKNFLKGKRAAIGARPEYQAIQKLESVNIKTLSVVGFGEWGANPAKQQSFLITKEITEAQSLEDISAVWRHSPPAFVFKKAIIEKLASVVSTLHAAGINHRDCYLCHFYLYQNPFNIGVIDLHRAQIRNSVPTRWLVKDLAGLYFSAMTVNLTRRDIFRFVKCYTQQPLREALQNPIWQRTNQKARALFLKESEKRVSSFSKLIVYNATLLNDSAKSFFKNIETAIEDSKTQVLKNDPNSSVFGLQFASTDLIVKRYNLRGFFYNLKRLVSKSRAMKSWQAGKVLAHYHIKTATPMAMIENRFGWFKRQSYFVAEKCEGVLLSDYFSPARTDAELQMALQAVLSLFAQLKHARIAHGDMKATNLLLNEKGIVLLDCDALTQCVSQSQFNRLHQKDIHRFMKNWRHMPTVEALFQCLMAKKS